MTGARARPRRQEAGTSANKPRAKCRQESGTANGHRASEQWKSQSGTSRLRNAGFASGQPASSNSQAIPESSNSPAITTDIHEEAEVSTPELQEKLRVALARALEAGELANLLGPKTVRLRGDKAWKSQLSTDEPHAADMAPEQSTLEGTAVLSPTAASTDGSPRKVKLRTMVAKEDAEISVPELREKLCVALTRSMETGELCSLLLGPRLRSIRVQSESTKGSPRKESYLVAPKSSSLRKSPRGSPLSQIGKSLEASLGCAAVSDVAMAKKVDGQDSITSENASMSAKQENVVDVKEVTRLKQTRFKDALIQKPDDEVVPLIEPSTATTESTKDVVESHRPIPAQARYGRPASARRAQRRTMKGFFGRGLKCLVCLN
jgi:hypothetical protein